MTAGPDKIQDRLRDVEEMAFASLVLELSLPEKRGPLKRKDETHRDSNADKRQRPIQ
jgi:hypothetical protein